MNVSEALAVRTWKIHVVLKDTFEVKVFRYDAYWKAEEARPALYRTGLYHSVGVPAPVLPRRRRRVQLRQS